MTNALDTVVTATRSASAEAEARYHHAVLALADDNDLDPAEVMDVAAAAGKDLDTLQADVARAVARRAAAAVYAEREPRAKAYNAATKRYQDLQDERDAYLRTMSHKLAFAKVDVDAAAEAIRDAKRARADLVATADPAMVARRTELDRDLTAANETVRVLREKVRVTEREANRPLPQRVSKLYGESRWERTDNDAIEAEVAKAKERLADLRERLAAAEHEAGRIEVELAEATAALLIP